MEPASIFLKGYTKTSQKTSRKEHSLRKTARIADVSGGRRSRSSIFLLGVDTSAGIMRKIKKITTLLN
jgi:hypothetical protein